MSDLLFASWANDAGLDSNGQRLSVSLGTLPVRMAHSQATGKGLITNGRMGSDLIRLQAGDCFQPHTHPGDHLLVVVGGLGTVTYDGKIYLTRAGQIFMIEGAVPHAVGAITDHVILAIGNPHVAIDSPDRMKPLEYRAVVSQVDTLHCLICDRVGTHANRLCDQGCTHCVCDKCRTYELT